MKVVVIGAGGQGGPCASILAHDKDISKVILADLNLDLAKKVKEKINSSKVEVVKVDASSSLEIAKIASGCDALIDLVIPEFTESVMKGALDAKCHYVNTAFYQPFFNELYNDQPLFLEEEFKKANRTALLGCGMAPGIINVIARLYADKLDTVSSIKLRLAKKKLGVEEMVTPWAPGWSTKQALLDCLEEAYVVENGKINITGPYTGLERYEFPEPLGEMLVSHHAHEEPLSMPRFIGKNLQYCDFKYYVSPHPAAFITAGLASEEAVDVNGVKIKPLDLLISLLPKASNAFLNEDPSKYEILDKTQYVCMMVEVEGTKNNKEKHYKIHLPKLTANGHKLNEIFGTSLINVALPAVIGAKMLVTGDYSGVISSECLDPNKFLEMFLATGIPYNWEVTEIK